MCECVCVCVSPTPTIPFLLRIGQAHSQDIQNRFKLLTIKAKSHLNATEWLKPGNQAVRNTERYFREKTRHTNTITAVCSTRTEFTIQKNVFLLRCVRECAKRSGESYATFPKHTRQLNAFAHAHLATICFTHTCAHTHIHTRTHTNIDTRIPDAWIFRYSARPCDRIQMQAMFFCVHCSTTFPNYSVYAFVPHARFFVCVCVPLCVCVCVCI